MNLKTSLLAAAVGSLFAMTAHAAVVTYTGDTSSGPTYDRVSVDRDTALPTGVAAGSGVNYNAYSFTVTTTGTYSFTTAGGFDTFGTLYAGGFDPSSSLTNAVSANDDLTTGVGASGLAYNLVAGTTYTFVNSAFLKGQGGFFSTSITGAGTVVPTTFVPAKATTNGPLLTYTGTTAGGPTYDRADTDGTSFFASTTDVAYQAFSFTVGAIGSYTFIANGDYDTFLSLYQGTFDPSNALTNLVGANDDAYNGAYNGYNTGYLPDVSAFASDLVTGTTYTLVTSGYGSDDSGLFSNAIVGPGAVSAVGPTAAVPEPAMVSLLFAGIGAIGIGGRRRRRT